MSSTGFTLPGEHLAERARTLDVFLDAVAAHSTTDASWVLDGRFEALLEDDDTEIARRAQGTGRGAARPVPVAGPARRARPARRRPARAAQRQPARVSRASREPATS